MGDSKLLQAIIHGFHLLYSGEDIEPSTELAFHRAPPIHQDLGSCDAEHQQKGRPLYQSWKRKLKADHSVSLYCGKYDPKKHQNVHESVI